MPPPVDGKMVKTQRRGKIWDRVWRMSRSPQRQKERRIFWVDVNACLEIDIKPKNGKKKGR